MAVDISCCMPLSVADSEINSMSVSNKRVENPILIAVSFLSPVSTQILIYAYDQRIDN